MLPAASGANQINFSPFKLACPSLPTMMWSCTAMPSGFATSMIACVICTSARDGVGSPEGWLWNQTTRHCIALIWMKKCARFDSGQARSSGSSLPSSFFRRTVMTRWVVSMSLTESPSERLLIQGTCKRMAASNVCLPLSVRTISCALR
jgi:hypothetical protein